MVPEIIATVTDELIRTDLQTLRDTYFNWLIGAAIFVFVGVCLEEAEILFPKRIQLAKRLGRLGWLLIMLGVAGEGVFETLVSRADGLLQEFNNIVLVSAKAQAESATLNSASAQKEASAANERASQNEKEAAQLSKQAEAEKIERLRLEQQVSPRILTIVQQQQISLDLQRFAGHTVVVSSYGLDAEGFLVATQVISALKAANISVIDRRASIIVSGGFVSGINVRGPATEDEFTFSLAHALNSKGNLQVGINGPSILTGGMESGGVLINGATIFAMDGGKWPTVALPPGSPVFVDVGVRQIGNADLQASSLVTRGHGKRNSE